MFTYASVLDFLQYTLRAKLKNHRRRIIRDHSDPGSLFLRFPFRRLNPHLRPRCLYKHQPTPPPPPPSIHQPSTNKVHSTQQTHPIHPLKRDKRDRASNGSHAQADRGGRAEEGGVRDVPRRLRRLLEGRGRPGQGPPRRRVGLPARRGRAPRRPRGAPAGAAQARLRRPGDRARVPAREPDPVRHGILRHQLLQAPHLGVRGVREDGVPGRGHRGVRQHRPPVRPGEGQLLRRHGLLLREDVEPHPAVQDRLLPAVPRQGCLAGARARRAPAAALLQRRHVRARAEHGHRQGSPREARRHRPHPFRRAGLPQHVLQGRVQAHPARLQPRARHALEAPREHPAPQGQGRPLLRSGFEAVEVHRRGGQHGQGGHQDAGEEMVGHLRRREPQLQACRRRGHRPAAFCPRRGRRRQVLPGTLRCLGSLQ